jgi:hypothetical protein
VVIDGGGTSRLAKEPWGDISAEQCVLTSQMGDPGLHFASIGKHLAGC